MCLDVIIVLLLFLWVCVVWIVMSPEWVRFRELRLEHDMFWDALYFKMASEAINSHEIVHLHKEIGKQHGKEEEETTQSAETNALGYRTPRQDGSTAQRG